MTMCDLTHLELRIVSYVLSQLKNESSKKIVSLIAKKLISEMVVSRMLLISIDATKFLPALFQTTLFQTTKHLDLPIRQNYPRRNFCLSSTLSKFELLLRSTWSKYLTHFGCKSSNNKMCIQIFVVMSACFFCFGQTKDRARL